MLRGNRPRRRAKGKLLTVLMSLNKLLSENNRYNFKKTKVVSDATRVNRARFLETCFRDLHDFGYKLKNVTGFKERHFIRLLQKWQDDEVTFPAIVNRISILKTFCRWIEKEGLIRPMEYYFDDTSVLKRSVKTRVDKTLSGNGICIAEFLARVYAEDPNVGIQLELQLAFSLRPQEAWLLKPIAADNGTYLDIAWGTKGGRHRTHPIDTESRRDVLERAKALATGPSGSTIPEEYTLGQWEKHYYYIMKKCGITRKNGFTSYYIRHEGANRYYEELTGVPSPIKRQGQEDKYQIDKELDDYARQKVAERLGHARKQISDAYIG